MQCYFIFIMFSDVQHLPSVLGVVGKGNPSSPGIKKKYKSHNYNSNRTFGRYTFMNSKIKIVLCYGIYLYNEVL